MRRKLFVIGTVVLGLLLLVGAAWASNQGPKLRDDTPPAAATVVAVQTLNVTNGITPTFSAASSGGNYFANDGRTFIEIKNASAGSVAVTVTVANTVNGLTIQNPSYTIPATTGDRILGPFDTHYFNDSSGNVTVNYQSVDSVTIGAFRLP